VAASEVSEVLGAHLALTAVDAEIWRKFAHGQIAASDLPDLLTTEQTARQLNTASYVFSPLSKESESRESRALLNRLKDGKDRSTSRAAAIYRVVLCIAAAAGLFFFLRGQDSDSDYYPNGLVLESKGAFELLRPPGEAARLQNYPADEYKGRGFAI